MPTTTDRDVPDGQTVTLDSAGIAYCGQVFFADDVLTELQDIQNRQPLPGLEMAMAIVRARAERVRTQLYHASYASMAQNRIDPRDFSIGDFSLTGQVSLVPTRSAG